MPQRAKGCYCAPARTSDSGGCFRNEAPPNERHRKVEQRERSIREGHEVSAGPVNLPHRRRCRKRHRWPVSKMQPESEEARPVAEANERPKAVADLLLSGQDAELNHRRVLTWFAGRWRNHQSKRAEKPHSKSSVRRCWTALLRGRKLRLPWRIASGSRQPPARALRLMSAWEREHGELPSPTFVPVGRKAGGHVCFLTGTG